jgi:hypothetical protein
MHFAYCSADTYGTERTDSELGCYTANIDVKEAINNL